MTWRVMAWFTVVGIWMDSQPRTVAVIEDLDGVTPRIDAVERISRAVSFNHPENIRVGIEVWNQTVFAASPADAKSMAEAALAARLHPPAVPVTHQDNLVNIGIG